MSAIPPEIKIEVFNGKSLFDRETDVVPIIENYLWERDVIMLLGSEKAGKSIEALQMGMGISSGGLFLGKYRCTKRPVIYLQTEGKKDETAKRMENMAQAVSLDKEMFFRVYKKFMPLNLKPYFDALREKFLAMPIRGGVLIVDCLYMAMVGDLNENEPVRDFLAQLTLLLEEFGLTCIIVHHAKREEYFEGQAVKKGDKVSFGSVFLRANVDHIIFLDMQADKSRLLTCDTQRSGQVQEREELVLVQPSPLFFKIKGDMTGNDETLLYHLEKGNFSKPQLMVTTGYSESTVERSLKNLVFSNRANIVDEIKSVHGQPTKLYGVIKNV